ncbi:hypothetical protein ACXZ1K_13515 [Pedobacter sp. PWIIR3]
MKNYTIYLVSQKNLNAIELLDAAFDSRAEAEAYAGRFKTHQQPDIIEITVNPAYVKYPTQDCYYLEINTADGSVLEYYIANTLQGEENALAGNYFIEHIAGQEMVCLYVMAATEKEAKALGLKRFSNITFL